MERRDRILSHVDQLILFENGVTTSFNIFHRFSGFYYLGILNENLLPIVLTILSFNSFAETVTFAIIGDVATKREHQKSPRVHKKIECEKAYPSR